MTFNGRNFQPRQTPFPEQRQSRFFAEASDICIGAPVVWDPTGGPDGDGRDGDGRTVMVLADGAQAPQPGLCGVAYAELEYIWARNQYSVLTSEVDVAMIPAGIAFQVWSGTNVKLWYKNTAAESVGPVGVYMENTYAARAMIAPAALGATPTITKGSLLTPASSPSDSNGYWQKTSTASEAWLRVVEVDLDNDEVEVVLAF